MVPFKPIQFGSSACGTAARWLPWPGNIIIYETPIHFLWLLSKVIIFAPAWIPVPKPTLQSSIESGNIILQFPRVIFFPRLTQKDREVIKSPELMRCEYDELANCSLIGGLWGRSHIFSRDGLSLHWSFKSLQFSYSQQASWLLLG